MKQPKMSSLTHRTAVQLYMCIGRIWAAMQRTSVDDGLKPYISAQRGSTLITIIIIIIITVIMFIGGQVDL